MSNYEFWDELGKIFNAVVAYQEKSVEFNKRFINPWIRLGNVFDKQDRTREAISAYEKAVEIDPASAQNWCDLGSAYFRAGEYDQAIVAFLKAIEFDPQLGWPYSNLALAYVTQDNHEQAVFLYQKSIELLEDNKDKAVSWNRLGNLYRKLNQYELAVQAFQKADELDKDNAGFRDTLDEVSSVPSTPENPVQGTPEQVLEGMSSPIQLIVEQSQVEDATQSAAEAQAAAAENIEGEVKEEPALPSAEVKDGSVEMPPAQFEETPVPLEAIEEALFENQPAEELEVVQTAEQIGRLPEDLVVMEEASIAAPTAEEIDSGLEITESESEVAPVVEAMTAELAAEAVIERPDVDPEPEHAPVAVQDVVETFTESIIALNTTTETTDVSLVDAEEKKEDSAPVDESVSNLIEVEVTTGTDEIAAGMAQVAEAPLQAGEAAAIVSESNETAAVAEEVLVDELVAIDQENEPVDAKEVEEEIEPVVAPVSETSNFETAAEPIAEPAPEVPAEESQVEPVSGPTAVETPVTEPTVEPVAEPALEASVEASPLEPVAEVPAEEIPAAEAQFDLVSGAASQEAPVAEAAVAPVVEAGPEPATEEGQAQPVNEQPAEPAVTETPAESKVEAVAEITGAQPQLEVPAEETGTSEQGTETAAYEEFLKDDGDALNVLTVVAPDEANADGDTSTPVEPITRLDASGELQIEMDTKNAHVWNELGNVYFNNGAVDDSIIAYSKAIELDRWFAWPYSNLALAYVQKGRFLEAVLLYQRSIELFTGEKDKAISWNRLGNVYRRLNDYEHAIEAYQRADELDPDNATLSLQSRFSLLGSYQLEQNATYTA